MTKEIELEEVRSALVSMLAETHGYEAVAEECRRIRGRGSLGHWRSMVSRWQSRDFRHPLPVWAARAAIRVCVPLGARDGLTPTFVAESYAAQDRARVRPGPVAVRREPARRRARA